MGKLPEEILAEKEHVEKVLTHLSDVLSKQPKTVIELSATATFLHNFYNGIENILKQLLKRKKISIPKGETWHKDLLNSALSNSIISEGLLDKLYGYLSFRHYFVHGYGFMLEEEQLEELTKEVFDVWRCFLREIS
ncbi:hypothetical protein MNBD_UNCLBAC01-145 [hydrothermal vent metagenome]|uniref:HepT-like domain-containing protein n=1 Tax=hydrothermal vent metagenome TaxID=652676 RepID=A0A3B1D2Y1_9ZZZZ